MYTSLLILLVMTVLGLFFGFILAYANKKFAVEVNPLIHLVEDVLPKGQCGACGYAGCQAYAEAVVLDPEVSPNLCIPGKSPVASAVAELTGKKAEQVEPRVAVIRCVGDYDIARRSYKYQGVEDCTAASVLFGGPKTCSHGCLGFGTCAAACPFGAISISQHGLPIIDQDKCTGCGKCQTVCPKQIIMMMPLTAKVSVQCRSQEKGAEVRKICSGGCIGCSLCMRECPHGAIIMANNLPLIDHKICAQCSDYRCVKKCPTKVLSPLILSPSDRYYSAQLPSAANN